MSLRTLGLTLLLAASSGCTVSARSQNEDQGPSNACSSDSDCGAGDCLQGICQTLNGHLESLLLEVTPTAESGLPQIPFVQHVDELTTSGRQRTISLARAVQVTGHLKPNDKPGCVRTFYGPAGNQLSPSTDGQSLPIKVTLTPRDSLLGLPAQVYLADASLPSLSSAIQGTVEYRFDLQVPAATYDLYLVPATHQVESTDPKVSPEECRIPPQLFRRELIAKDAVINYPALATSRLLLSVVFPESGGSLDGWVVDVIEPLSGNPISSERVLSEPTAVALPDKPGKGLKYLVPLAYGGVTERGGKVEIEGASDLVRLRPPAGLVAPTIFLDRAGLGLFANDASDEIEISGFTKFPEAVVVEGHMLSLDGGSPTSGRLELVSTEIFGVDPGMFASFRISATVDEQGFFSLQIPPGKYRVYGTPQATSDTVQAALASREVSWEVSADVKFQGGRLLELPPRSEVRGHTSLRPAEVQVVSSHYATLPFADALGQKVFVPRAASGPVDAAGRFVVATDPGTFDIWLRPPEESGFPWFVRPRFEVQSGTGVDLGRVTPPLPSLLVGDVVVGSDGSSVPSALIRAYAYLEHLQDDAFAYTGDPLLAHSVVQVAQTRTDADGKFRLLIPADISTK